MLELEDAMQALREAVEERGSDYCYPIAPPEDALTASCHYKWTPEDADRYAVPVGKPACGVGVALAKRGVLDTIVPSHTSENNSRAIGGIPGVRHHISGPAIEVLACFQGVQDGGRPWGVALRQAEEYHLRLQNNGTTLG